MNQKEFITMHCLQPLTEGNSSLENFTLPTNSSSLPHTEATYIIKNIITPIVFSLGILGNLVSLAVFCHKSQSGDHVERSATTGLITLAMSDLLFCLIGFSSVFLIRDPIAIKPDAFTSFTFQYRVNHGAILNVFLFTSTWLIILISSERFIGICFPFVARKLIRVPRTLFAHALVFLSSVIINLPLFFKWSVVAMPCYHSCICFTQLPSWLLQHKTFEEIHIFLWFTLGTFIPLLILLFCNSCILRAVYRSRRRAAANSEHEQGALSRITWTLLSIVLCYFLLVCPSMMLQFLTLDKFHLQFNIHLKSLAVVITNLLQAIKFSCNFLLYCAIHRRFREALAVRISCVGRTTLSPSAINPGCGPKRVFQMIQFTQGKSRRDANCEPVQV